MLPKQTNLPLSSYSELYDIIVPKDNKLRRISELIDFGFVYDELKGKYCPDNGRTAQDSVRMFKYLFLKTMFDLSDEDVIDRSRYGLSFKYFLGMSPEEDVVEASTLCKFRRQRLKDTDMLGLLIGKAVGIAVEHGLIRSGTIIVDATHTGSRSNPHSPVEMLKLRSHQLRKALHETDGSLKGELPNKNGDDDLLHEMEYTQGLVAAVSEDGGLLAVPKVAERLNMLKETLDDIMNRYTTSVDADARIGHKDEDGSFFGYKTHVAMSDERIITAATVTSGEKGDGPQIEELVRQTRSNGVEVDTVLGDSTYSGDTNLKFAEREDVRLVSKVTPAISRGLRGESDVFGFNKDAGMFVCPTGHMAVRKAIQGKKGGPANRTCTYCFDTEKCKVCSRREGCYKPGAKTRSYSVTIKTGQQPRQVEFQKTDEFRRLSRERYKIEAKNSEMKNVHGYGRAKSYGIGNMTLQEAMTIFTVNVKRIITLIYR